MKKTEEGYKYLYEITLSENLGTFFQRAGSQLRLAQRPSFLFSQENRSPHAAMISFVL